MGREFESRPCQESSVFALLSMLLHSASRRNISFLRSGRRCKQPIPGEYASASHDACMSAAPEPQRTNHWQRTNEAEPPREVCLGFAARLQRQANMSCPSPALNTKDVELVSEIGPQVVLG